MSEKITFTFSVSEARMEVSCSEEFVSRQMERFEHVLLAWAEALGGRMKRSDPGSGSPHSGAEPVPDTGD